MIDIMTGMKYLSLLASEQHTYDPKTDNLVIIFAKNKHPAVDHKSFYNDMVLIDLDNKQMPVRIEIKELHKTAQNAEVKKNIKEIPPFIVDQLLEHFGFTRKELGWDK